MPINPIRIAPNGCILYPKSLYLFELTQLEDPNHAPAWSGLAEAHFLLGFYDFLAIREALARAKPAAEKAVAWDDNSAEAHRSLITLESDHAGRGSSRT